LFLPIIHAVEELSGVKYAAPNLMSFRVIADHARTMAFALSDGANFSNEGRGYVLRRVIRRAMRYGQKIGLKEPFMHKLIDVVVDEYKDFYPNLAEKRDLVKKMVKNEEEKFLKTLVTGEAILRDLLEEHKDIKGEEAFKLYDSFGFPLELTLEIAKENGGSVDVEGFQKKMEEQRIRARNARGEVESFKKQSKDLLAFKEQSSFDYDSLCLKAKVIGLFVDGVAVDKIDEKGEIALDVTPF
ncbi:MAG: alanine--tRNA ligase, partial [Bacilli bacterium]|nr:alanine--tRNA ligase [Bacilli bacterium]